jgi:HPt (histidine-containing phosphotransfer) domain-containing protein
MKDIADMLPGIERIQQRFLDMLKDRQGTIAHHVLAAWESKVAGEVVGHLDAAKAVLHQIAGSAGSLGFDELGQAARDCENEIISHLRSPEGELITLPAGLMKLLGNFLTLSKDLIGDG